MKPIFKLHPDKFDQEVAQHLLKQFILFTKHADSQLALDLGGQHFKINENILGLFMAMLEKISKGESVSLLPKKREYSTQETADILNVSRPYVLKLLDRGAIPFRWVGSHRRINRKDLKFYKKKMDKDKKEAFEELAKLGQEIENA